MNKNDKWWFDGNKLLWHMDRVHEHFRDGKRIAPIHIDCAITKKCNAKCIYCYGIHQDMNQKQMSTRAVLNLFGQAASLGVKSLSLIGDGENTLHPDYLQALRLGKESGLDLCLATNGIAIDGEAIADILYSCISLRFNLSAVGEEGYKAIHGVPQWKKVQDNIVSAVEFRDVAGIECTIGLQMVLTPETLKFVEDEAKFALESGVDYFVIKQYSDPGDERMSPYDQQAFTSDSNTYLILKRAEEMSTEETRIIPKWSRIWSKGERPYDKCVDCPLLFQISGDGKCYPCGFLFGNPDYCYGDLEEQTLKEIIEGERYWNVVKYMREKFDVHKDCKGSCRHDSTNEFIWRYLNPPEHINII